MDEKEVFEDQVLVLPGGIAYPMQQIAVAVGMELNEIVQELLEEYIQSVNNFIIGNENKDTE